MAMLSVVIPGRNEVFMVKTIDNLLQQIRGSTEICAILDGYWPDPPIVDHPRVKVIHHTEAVGQRAATNDGCRFSRAKYLMKLDAHCAVDEGFDVKLMEPYENGEIGMDTTTIPRMYNLHAFSWKCDSCANETYQGPRPEQCDACKATTTFTQVMVWKPRLSRRTDFARFDANMQFQYWRQYDSRPESKGDIADVMTSVGACWMMPAEHFWNLGGMDEAHGSWGQFGTEISCKNWLSGGRQVVNKRTWFSHLFRTQWKFQWPYPITQGQIDRAREYSKQLWLNDAWPKAKRPLKWLVDKFAPVPEWHDPPKEKQGA
jgi:glycosyltransferase involved in cell wall biosynthesis